jgi:hypothetical protein
MNIQDLRAMFELQLELHCRARGLIPPISTDEVLELHELLTRHAADLNSLVSATA